ncbi:shikimate kinase [Porticoccaceae bacterium]|jgi:shikimate kinase|nr:shikimate kinase [Porticoccaceae bacterium]MDC0134014.1 shikimate kinase [Porticoccaceae bacterium]MDC1476672.1 shikimate kinase [Porticoccaceae bacterium]CAI8318024.1 MAG: Shikimate kinase 1 [SAR92 bacterium MED-G29]|tara:strand:+ start:14796 stop:15314 length:519 start_codon:yes stop_codon:yes gene_type:complete
MNEQHIFLVGPMGAGKSTIGRHLAAFLNRPFFDIDNEIEARTGADIQWIFDMEGEEGFRVREAKALLELIQNDTSSVIATGGGIVLREDNREALRENGQVIYLSATKEQLYDRTRKDKSRPLLQVDNRREVIDQLVEKRDPLYRGIADLVFPSGSVPPGKLVKSLAQALTEL